MTKCHTCHFVWLYKKWLLVEGGKIYLTKKRRRSVVWPPKYKLGVARGSSRPPPWWLGGGHGHSHPMEWLTSHPQPTRGWSWPTPTGGWLKMRVYLKEFGEIWFFFFFFFHPNKRLTLTVRLNYNKLEVWWI
jgi:hypothetical protein